MPKPGKRTSVIMYAELVAILALTAVLNWRNSQQNAELSAHLIADNATRLRQEDEEAKILLAGYVQSKAPLLKDGCQDLARTISGELADPWWRADMEGLPVYDDAQWKRMKLLAEPVIAALSEPDKIGTSLTTLNAKADAVKEELRLIIQRQSNIAEYSRLMGAYLLVAQSLLQIVVTVLYAILMWSIRKDRSQSF